MGLTGTLKGGEGGVGLQGVCQLASGNAEQIVVKVVDCFVLGGVVVEKGRRWCFVCCANTLF